MTSCLVVLPYQNERLSTNIIDLFSLILIIYDQIDSYYGNFLLQARKNQVRFRSAYTLNHNLPTEIRP